MTLKNKNTGNLSVSRCEVKYLLSLPGRLFLLDALNRLLIPDAYGGYNGYMVRSVYFDSIANDDYALLETVGIQPDHKLILVSIAAALILALVMLGSLSIVRFRTNIRDPRDIGFIFWAMAIGIAASTV